MSGLIEFCVELQSAAEGGAATATETDSDVSLSHQPAGQAGNSDRGRGGRRGKLRRQSSVVCSRVHTLNTISYVDNGESGERPSCMSFISSVLTIHISFI